MDRFDYLIVGAGFAGSVCAERLASAGKTVLLIDQRNHIGGNAFDYYDEAGILVHKYGPHIFHTNSEAVFDYLSAFTEWRPYQHLVEAEIGGGRPRVPMPINRTTLAAFDGDLEAAFEALIRPYTRKQWGCEPEELDPAVLARVKVRDSDDDRYFQDVYQFMPLHGYTRLFERLTAHPRIKILLKASYREILPVLKDGWASETAVIYTGPIDEYFDYRFGKLPYRSARFELNTFTGANGGFVDTVGVINIPSADVGFTRVTEFKRLTGQEHPNTTLCFEYPTAAGDPFWPIPKPENAALYQRYRELLRNVADLYFCGRLGTYAYLNIDQVVAQALKLSTRLLTGGPNADAVKN